MEFLLKFLLCFGGVGRDAQEDDTGFLNLLVSVAKATGLDGTSGGIGARVEIEDDDFAAQGLEGSFFAVLVLQSKVRGLIIDVQGIDFEVGSIRAHGHLISFRTKSKVAGGVHGIRAGSAETRTKYLQKFLIPHVRACRHLCPGWRVGARWAGAWAGGTARDCSAEDEAADEWREERK
jgi:hypothetical protein